MKTSNKISLLLTALAVLAITLGASGGAAQTNKAIDDSLPTTDPMWRHIRDAYTLYVLQDIADPTKNLGKLVSTRSINIGETIYVGGDNWLVKFVRIVTEPHDVPNAAENKIYRINHVSLQLEFIGKSTKPADKAK